ncbi:MAG: hypothetical protein IPP35_10180 [Elusimicrobia bacterium]|nr:hypothetical protein [Elusimicrobiota bacterium]
MKTLKRGIKTLGWLSLLWVLAASRAQAVDSYFISIATNVMRGDTNVTLTLNPLSGGLPDLTAHNAAFVGLPPGVSVTPNDTVFGVPVAGPTGFTLLATGAAPLGPMILTAEKKPVVGVQGTISINIQRVVHHFDVVPPFGPFTGTAGVPFAVQIVARDSVGGVVSGFHDNVDITASTGDVIVNGVSTFINGTSFVNGIAVATIQMNGTDPGSRTNRLWATAQLTYVAAGQAAPATGYVDMTINPNSFDHITLLFPGERLTPGTGAGKIGAANPAVAGIGVLNVSTFLVDLYHNPVISAPGSVSVVYTSLSHPGPPNPPGDIFPGLRTINSGNQDLMNGLFSFTISGVNHTIRAQVFPGGPISDSSIFVNSAAPSSVEISTISTPQTATSFFAVSARVRDVAGNTVVSYNGPMTVSANNCLGTGLGNNTLDTNPGLGGVQNTVNFVAGVWVGAVKVLRESLTACIRFDDGAGFTGDSNLFLNNHGPLDHLHLVLPGQSFTPGAYPGNDPSLPPSPQLAGNVVAVQVWAVDASWNPVPSPANPVTIAADNSAFPAYVDIPGTPNMVPSGGPLSIAGITLRTAYPSSLQRLTASMSGTALGVSDYMNVGPRPYNQIIFVAPGETLEPGINPIATGETDGKTGTISTAAVNVPVRFDVYLTDSYFNPITNPPLAGGLWPILNFTLPSGGVWTLPFVNPFQMSSGLFPQQLTLGTLGPNVVRVRDNSPIPKQVDTTISVQAGPVDHFVVTPNALSVTADPIPNQTVGVPFLLTFKAFDQFNNLSKNFGGLVQLELWENGAPVPYAGTISPSTITFVADPVLGGVVTQPITITYAGPSLLTGADQLQVRAFYSTSTVREGFSALFNVKELIVCSGIVLTLPGETRTPGLGLGSLKSGSPSGVLAGNSFPVTVTAVDLYGNKIDQAAIANLGLPTLGVFANLGSPAQVVLANGTGTGFVQVYTAGPSVIVASITALGFQNSSTVTVNAGSYSGGTGRLLLLAPGEVHFPGSPSDPGKNSVSISSVQANTSMSYTLLACDRFYNKDVTYSGNTFSLNSNDTAISLSGVAVNSGSTTVSGVFLRGMLPTNPCTVRVTATDQSAPAKTSYSDVPVTPGAFYQFTVLPATALAGQNFNMTVTLVDPVSGLPVPTANNAINLQALDPALSPATVPLGTGVATLNAGSVIIPQSYSYVETIRIRVTDSFNRVADSGNITITPNGLKYVVTLPPAAKSTDDIFSVTVGLYDTIQDALPIQDTSYQHTFGVSVEVGTSPAVGSFPVSAATLTNGLATFNFSYTKAEHIVVRASGTLGVFPTIVGFDDMDITPGAYVKVQILAPGEVAIPGIPSLTGKDSSGLAAQAAQESFSVQVNAVDRYWNVVTSLNTALAPSVRLTSSDGALAAMPVQSFSNGQALFAGVKLSAPPQVTVTAQDISSVSLFPQSVVIPITGRTYVAVLTPNFPPNFYSGPPRDFHVDLSLYRFTGVSTGALVTGFTGTVDIEPVTLSLQPLPVGNLVIVNPPVPDVNHPNRVRMDPSGLLNLTLGYRVAEDVILKFVDEGGWQGFSAPIHFIPRDVDYVATIPAENRVGPPDSFTMTVAPRDRDTGTTAKNWSQPVTLSAVSPAALPVTGTLQVTNLLINAGAYTFQQAFSQAGLFYFQMTDGVRTSTSASMNFIPGPLAGLTTNLPATLEAGTTQAIQVTLVDAYSNPIPNLPVTFQLPDPTFGTLSTLSGVSDVAGQASTLFVTNAQKSGTGEFVGASGGASVRQFFRLLGPPLTTLRVGGRGVAEDKGFAIKPGDPIFLDVQVETGTVLLSLSYSIDGGPTQVYGGPFVINDVGRHTVQYFGVTQSGVIHTETLKTSKTLFVSAPTTPDQGLLNYPNPFRAGRDLTYLEYNLPGDSGVRLTIYDLMGQKVREQSFSQGEAGGQTGLNRISWDGRNDDGVAVGNGGYVAVLESAIDGSTFKRKIAVIK